MDELSAFERRLTAGLDALAGPRRSVDAAAIARASASRGSVRSSILPGFTDRSCPPSHRSTRGEPRPCARPVEPLVNRFSYLVAAAIAVITVVAVGAGGLLNAPPSTTVSSLPPPSSTAPSPVASPSTIVHRSHNGLIAVVRAGALVLVDPATGDTTKVLVEATNVESGQYAASDITWAPDGRRLAFVSHDGPIRVIDIDTGALHEVFSCGIEAFACTIAWSPDGARIAVAQRGQLNLIDPDGGNLTRLPLLPKSILQPTWSPDGTRIAFHVLATGLEDQDRRLYVVDRDGSNLTLLLGPVPGLGIWDPAWSPDGSTIAYLGSTDHQTCPPPVPWASQRPCQDDWQLHIMVLGLDGSGPREVVEAGACFCGGFMPGLTWSPDGTSLAAVIPSDDDRPWGVYIANADGTGKRPVADAWGPVGWQPIP